MRPYGDPTALRAQEVPAAAMVAAAEALVAGHPGVSFEEAALLVSVQVLGHGRPEVPDAAVAQYVAARDHPPTR